MIDLSKPMHFTKEQSEWIKAYVILKKQEAKAEAVEYLVVNGYIKYGFETEYLLNQMAKIKGEE